MPSAGIANHEFAFPEYPRRQEVTTTQRAPASPRRRDTPNVSEVACSVPMMEIVRLHPGDEQRIHDAAHLFDDPPRKDATTRFLAEPTHHLLLAYEDGRPAGFVSGVEVTHPDKGTEMFLYELGVAEQFRRRGIGRALLRALAALARGRGCYGMFVLTDDWNEAALATYDVDDARRENGIVMFSWDPL